MADALISMLLERLASTTYEYIGGGVKDVFNVKEDVDKFTRTLRVIQAVLEDAEQRQVTDQAVKIWLDELKDISYQMVDVLDEWNTDILKQQIEKQEREQNALVAPNKKCDDLESLPKGIGRLTSLQTLDVCLCGGDNDEAFQIGDLGKLNLEGSLKIELVEGATDKSEVEKAQLWDKKLFHLTIDCGRLTNSRSSVEILNALRPHRDLESLEIWYHNGTTWPNWVQSLHNLRFLTVGGGTQCELWPLGKLESLETLTLWNMDGVRKVGVEFLGLEDQTSFRIRSPLILFPKLKRLNFEFMWNWEEWEGVEEWTKEDSEITIMPCLSELTIFRCYLLEALPDFLFKTPLQTLIILGSERLLDRYEEGNGEWAKISATNPNIRMIRD